MPRQTQKPMSLTDIHNALEMDAEVSTQDLPPVQEENENEVQTNSLQAVRQGEDESPFHDALHKYSIFARPITTTDLSELVRLIRKLIGICGTSNSSWKVFTLTAFLRRYHGKAPEARVEKDTESVGDGERLLFYTTLLVLYRFWLDTKMKAPEQSQLAFEAAACMIRTASRIGGTRDLCAIIEHLTMARLLRTAHLTGDNSQSELFADELVPAVHFVVFNDKPDALLELSLMLAARQLDDDLRMLADVGEKQSEDLLSTIHVMVPHNRRGSNTAKAWQRKLVNSVAEILIWQRTAVTHKDERFARALKRLALLSPTDIAESHTLIQQLQTTARKKRQLLNNYARKQGFLLTSSYQLDKTNLTLRQLRRAKAGDLRMLEKLARKKGDTRTLSLIAKRKLDPSKATAALSIQDLTADWVDIAKDYEGDEVAALELSIQTLTVQATLEKLRCASSRSTWVTCVGSNKNNLVCAILVATALEKSRLFLAGEEYDVSDIDKCIELINQVIHKNAFAGGNPVSIEEMLTSKVELSQDVLVLSSRDLELDGKVLEDVQARDISIRVHATERIETFDKITLSLNSNIYDRIKAREPMSLGVMLDCTGSMGGEIEGCKKGAIDMISTFQELAPVGSVNIMGYWDPVYCRSDPLPKSTGYLEANKENMDVLQQFVNTKLVCQGGGDEPEDIPEALERYVEDMRKSGLSAAKGVHFLFFIADAGFRENETERVQDALETLKNLGVIMVLCQVRQYSDTLPRMVEHAQECFKGEGRYIELKGVGQLAAIAAGVTESIRASLFQSNVKAVAASVGSTIDTIRKLATFQADNALLKKAEDLVNLSPEESPKAQTDEEIDTEDKKAEKKVFAEKKEFCLTSRDRLYLQLSRLPKICHDQVLVALGGKSLQVIAAEEIANQLREEDIPLAAVEKAGYPRDILELVQNVMAGHGIERVVD